MSLIKNGLARQPSTTRNIILILLIVTVGLVSTDIYMPSLPAVANAFHITQGMAQQTITFFLLSFALSQLFYGPLSDYYGRRPILIAGFCIYLFSTVLSLMAKQIDSLLLARFLQGLGIGAGITLGRVMLRDCFSGNKLATMSSYMGIGVSFTIAISPAIGGYIQQYYGYQGNFLFMLFYGLLAFVLFFFYLPETNRQPTNTLAIKTILSHYRQVLTNHVFMGNALCSALALSGIIAYSVINPFLLENLLHISPNYYGLLSLAVALGLVAGAFINSQIVSRFGIYRMMKIGILAMGLAGLLLLFTQLIGLFNVPAILLPIFFATIGMGFILPNTIAGAFTPFPHIAGTVGAIFGTLQILCTAITSALAASIHETDQLPLAIIFLSLSLMSLVSLYIAKKNDHIHSANLG